MFWCPCSWWATIDDHARIWATCYFQNGALLVSSLVWLLMMGFQDGLPSVPKSSWGILGQLDTRGLSQGIPDLEEPRCGATGAYRCSYSVVCCHVLTVHLLVVMTIVSFYSSWVGSGWCQYHVWDAYLHCLLGKLACRLVVRKRSWYMMILYWI